MENVSYHVVAGKIGKDLLGEIINAVIYEETDSESLKLKIYEAIS
jgi:death-on-curing protein